MTTDQLFQDLLTAERNLRAQAEQRARALTEALAELAYRLDGQRLEAARQSDPLAPGNWDAAAWRAYFSSALPGKAELAAGWGNPLAGEVKKSQAEVEQLQAEVERLQAELKTAHAATVAPVPPAPTPVAMAPADEKPVAPEPPSVSVAAQPAAVADSVTWPERWPKLPARWAAKFAASGLPGANEPARQARLYAVLWLAASGLSIRMEMGEALARHFGLAGRNSGSNYRMFDMAEKAGLLEQQVLPLTLGGGGKTRLAVCALAPEGRDLCSAFGWKLQESEWARLRRLHQGDEQTAHTCAVLAFVFHARLRGWTAQVLPDVNGPARPDAAVAKDGATWQVEVELSADKDKNQKWRNLAALNGGRVALAAADVDRRLALTAEVRADRLAGMATDLETLIKTARGVDSAGPLWVESW